MRYITWNKPKQPTEQELRALMIKEGLKPYILTLEKDQTTGVLQSNKEETRVVVMGKIEVVAEGRTFKLKVGDRMDIDANTPYIAKNIENGQTAILCATKGQTVFIEIY